MAFSNRFIAVLLLAILGFARCSQAASAVPESDCRIINVGETRYTHCRFDPAAVDLRLFLAGADGNVFRSFEALSQSLWRDHAFLEFAINGGMYHDDLSPVGLFIENGQERRPIVLTEGYGNFHLLPNGVFHFGDGRAGVMESSAFARSGLKPRFATQSGPMLVIDGALHPRFLPDSDSFKIRNGVGVDRAGNVHFVVSESRVRFHDFAQLFRDVLDCPNALYLDGTISSALIPSLGRHDRLFPMGPIIGIVSRIPD